MPADLVQAVCALRDQHAAAPRGSQGELLHAFALDKGVSVQKVYRWLREVAQYQSGRKPRRDRGNTRLPQETLDFIAASINQSVRRNGIATKPVCVAMNIAHENGLAVNVSSSRVSTLLREQRLDVKTQANARNHQRQRSLHPNHVHQIDPSLCLVYYINGKQYVMREEEFNKNKPVAQEKVKLKVWRYVRYDHASGSLDVRYFEAAGENQVSLFEFLLYTWGANEKRLSHGVPKMLLWDKGSANTSAGIRRLLDALGVHHETHATHHAWVKGGVESGNWIVERHFESRLRDEPVDTVRQLNASAENWVRDYCANVMPHIDSRIRRDDGQRYVRDDLWNLISHTEGALVQLPDRAACAWYMRGKDETRIVRDGHISFVHPQSGKSELYSLQAYAREWANGQTLRVSPMLMGDCTLRVWFERPGKDPLHADVTPEREFDRFGRSLGAVVLGQERRTAPHTAAQWAAKEIAQTTYGPGTSLDEAEALRSKNVRPFQHFNDGKGVVAHTHLGKVDLPPRLLPAAQDVKTAEMADMRAQLAERRFTLFEAAAELARRGVAMSPERNALVAQWHPEGVPEGAFDDLAHRLAVRAGLRVVAGGAAGE